MEPRSIQHDDESILITTLSPPSIPIGPRELAVEEQSFFRQMRIAFDYVEHTKCGHAYYVKFQGVRHRQLRDDPDYHDIGHCSVCYQFRRTPRNLQGLAQDLIEEYQREFPVLDFLQRPRYTWYNQKIQSSFYIWLYLEKFSE